MITREEIERLISSENAESTVDFVWNLNCAAIPELSADGQKGDDCRFSFAEHIVHKLFDTKTLKDLPGGVFTAFCERLHADEQDTATALAHTRQDFKTADVADADVATTLVWIWFAEADRKYGTYDAEFRFLLYSASLMCRNDAEVKQRGREHLAHLANDNPSPIFRLLDYLFKKHTRA